MIRYSNIVDGLDQLELMEMTFLELNNIFYLTLSINLCVCFSLRFESHPYKIDSNIHIHAR